MELNNIFSESSGTPAGEIFETLVKRDEVTIERIISTGQATPPGEWYDQETDEWVILLAGAAQLIFEDGREIELKPGDYLLIPACCRHRVEWTDPKQQSIWLAVHFSNARTDNNLPRKNAGRSK